MDNNYNKLIKITPYLIMAIFLVVSLFYLRIPSSINPQYYAKVVAIESEYKGTIVVSTKLQYNPKVMVVTEGGHKGKEFDLSEESDLFLDVDTVIPVVIEGDKASYLIKKNKAYLFLVIILTALIFCITRMIRIYFNKVN